MLSATITGNFKSYRKMALEEFEREQLSERERNMVKVKSFSNYIMGVFWLIAGCFFMFPTPYTEKFLANYDSALIKFFAVVCWIYGLFRIYRGYKKNYFY
jgi:hypothetical protein